MISLFIVIMVTFIVIILFFIKKKQKGFTSDLNAVKENYDKELYKAQMEIQEQTFGEISREIHDNIGQLLSIARLSISSLDFEDKIKAKQEATEISSLLDKALEDTRHISHAMKADFIKKKGLEKSIELQVEFLKRNTPFQIQFKVEGPIKRIVINKEIILFRIFQEAINNIIRHSGATEINIKLIYDENHLVLSIGDNGNGIVNENTNSDNTQSNGISNMQHRTLLIGAQFEIESRIKKGTIIKVTVNY